MGTVLLSRHFPSTLLATIVIITTFLTVASALPTPQLLVAPRISHDSVQSTNWSGFAVTGPTNSVTDAKGSWIVPTIQGTCPSTNQYSSFWVGIDGYNSGTVEQTGTDSDCQGGTPTYYAWYEFYPHPSFIFSGLVIHPGDKMSAEAQFSSKSFTVTITDTTTGASASKSARVSGAQRSSAEWIAEAPSSSGGILPLANFGTVSYGTDNTGIASTCYATISGATGPIGSFNTANVHQITMVTSGGATKAQPSALSSDGTSFTVKWVSSGP
jgi:peptidase A4-like protein